MSESINDLGEKIHESPSLHWGHPLPLDLLLIAAVQKWPAAWHRQRAKKTDRFGTVSGV